MSNTLTVTVKVAVEPVARISKSTGKPYRGIQITGYHRPGYLPLAAAKSLAALAADKAFVAELNAAIRAAESANPKAE